MNIWIIYDKEDYDKNKLYFKMHVERGKKHNITFTLVFSDEITYKNLPDIAIMRSRDYKITEKLELLGVKVCNNSYVSRLCNNKWSTYELVKKLDIPVVFTKLIAIGTSINTLNNIADKKNKVIKTVDGHGGNEVYLLENFINERKSIEKDMVLQLLVEGEGKDLRVYVVDNKIVSSVLRTATDGFKSNYSLGGKIEQYNLSKDEEEIVYKIIDLFRENTCKYSVSGLFYVGIDFIIDKDNQLIFNEIEDVVGSRMLYNTSDIDIVDYTIGKYLQL